MGPALPLLLFTVVAPFAVAALIAGTSSFGSLTSACRLALIVKLRTCCGSSWPLSTGEGEPGPGGPYCGWTLMPWGRMDVVGTPSFSSAERMASSRACISATAASTSAGPDFDCAEMFTVCGVRNTSDEELPGNDAEPVTVIVGGSGTGAGSGAASGATGGEAR